MSIRSGMKAVPRAARILLGSAAALMGANLLVPYLLDLPQSTLWGFAHRRHPPIVLIVVDCMRPDHLPAYGYPRPTSPNIGVLAFEGLVFDQVFSASPATGASIASLASGRYPGAILPPASPGDSASTPLPERVVTLAEALRDGGYRTMAYVDQPAVSADLHYDQGFEDFAFMPRGWHEWRGTRGRDVVEDVGAQLDRAGAGPFFSYIELVYPHRPYDPPEYYQGNFGPGFTRLAPEEKAGVVNRYDEEILYADDVIGGIVGQLRKRGIFERAWIVVTSGNGEGFWEHGLEGHGNSLYRELLWVPFIVHPPGGRDASRSVRVPDLLSLVDVYPTLLEIAGVDTPPGALCDGSSFAPLLTRDRRTWHDTLVFSEHADTRIPDGLGCTDGRFRFIYAPPAPFGDEETMVEDVEAGRYTELYDLRYDPAEKFDATGHFPLVAMRLGTLVAQHAERNRQQRTGAAVP